MKLYLAAVYSNSYMPGQNRFVKLTDHEKELVTHVPNILESYHYVHKPAFVDAMRINGAQIFLDSGAFSAYTLGVTINVEDYCKYIWTNWDIVKVEDGVLMASVLDGIGDPLLTYQNQKRMEQLGVKPLPCFHAGEDERYLEYYVSNYEYITLGGMVGSSTKQLFYWLDRIWDRYLCDGAGRPRLKVHGFGITSIPIMERYPWWSCDSSSWIQSAAFGSVVTPDWGPVSVSGKSPSRHDLGQHATTLPLPAQEIVFNKFHEQGFDYPRLSEVYESRAAYNLWAYRTIGDRIHATVPPVLTQRVQGLF